MTTDTFFGGVSQSAGLYGTPSSYGGGQYLEWFIFQVSPTPPATPTGGSWNFTNNIGTPPTGWSTTAPLSPTSLVWVSIALVNSQAPSSLTWSTPGQFAFSGASIPGGIYGGTF